MSRLGKETPVHEFDLKQFDSKDLPVSAFAMGNSAIFSAYANHIVTLSLEDPGMFINV